jgi:hypothetical protein
LWSKDGSSHKLENGKVFDIDQSILCVHRFSTITIRNCKFDKSDFYKLTKGHDSVKINARDMDLGQFPHVMISSTCVKWQVQLTHKYLSGWSNAVQEVAVEIAPPFFEKSSKNATPWYPHWNISYVN